MSKTGFASNLFVIHLILLPSVFIWSAYWWFEGQQNLAAQFLVQFSARLPRESKALREIGNVLAEYADAVGSVVAASTGIPLVGKLSFVLKLLKRKSKDVPALKAEISKLCESRRFQSSWETPGKQSQTPL